MTAPDQPLVDEVIVADGRRYRVEWFDPPWPPRDQMTHALGVCFTPTGSIVLVTLDGTDWSLPGGTVEAGETLPQTLAREVREEACARVLACAYIGCQRVTDVDGDAAPYYRTRFWARVELLRRYTHTLPGELERARDLLDAFLAERTKTRRARA